MRAPARAWTPEDDQAVRAMRGDGATAAVIAAALGRTVASVQNRIVRLPAEQAPAAEAAPGEAWQALRGAEDRATERKREAYDLLRPVDLPPLPRVPVMQSAAAAVVVYGCTHFGQHDPRAMEIVYRIVEELRPALCIANGDISDLGGLGRFPRHLRPGTFVSLRDEQQATKSHWRTIGGLTQAWGGRHVQHHANHDGETFEGRWERWLSDRLGPDFLALEGAEDLSYSRYFHHPDVPVEMREETVLPGRLRVRHGRVVRKHGGASARAAGHDQLLGNILMSHTHRSGFTAKRVPALDGFTPERTLRMYETGCLCKIPADYAPDADWTQGAAIVHVDAAGDRSAVELVVIEDGAAVVASLGKTVRA